MSPPIISQSSTPTQSRFTTANDHFSPGLSRPNNMSRTIDLEAVIEEWIDALNSPLSTPAERVSVLNDIEKTLVRITSAERTTALPGLDQASTFWALQSAAGSSLAEVLVAHVYRLHLELERENESGHSRAEASGSSSTLNANVRGLGLHLASTAVSGPQRQHIQSAVSEMCISITILQGLTLCSQSSKRITSRKSSLELLLAIVLADYCTQLLPPILCPGTPSSPSYSLPHSPSTPSTSASKNLHAETHDAPLSLPSGFALDLLMCVLVDSPLAQERFSDMGGIHQVVQLSHKCADTVTTPATTPTSPDFAGAAARSSHIVALKQTDLLCLEFRYFWTQVLQSDHGARRVSLETGVAANAPSAEAGETGSTTPRASPRKRASRADLRQAQSGETPKAASGSGRGVERKTKTARATSEEAPTSRIGSSRAGEAVGEGSPRKLRHSVSVAELRKKPSLSGSRGVPPLPPLPTMPLSDSPQSIQSHSDALSARRQRPAPATRPSTASGSQAPSAAISQPHVRDRVRRSTVSEAPAEPAAPFNPSRPGMSSRDRPRIPSPLKPRTPAQEASEREARLLRKQAAASQQAIPYRRLRSSTTSTPFGGAEVGERSGRSRDVVAAVADDGDGENRNPFSVATTTGAEKGERLGYRASTTSSPFDSVLATPTSRAALVATGAAPGPSDAICHPPTASKLGVGTVARIPPSPAVRRAQLARARSLSPTKLCLPAPTTATSTVEF